MQGAFALLLPPFPLAVVSSMLPGAPHLLCHPFLAYTVYVMLPKHCFIIIVQDLKIYPSLSINVALLHSVVPTEGTSNHLI